MRVLSRIKIWFTKFRKFWELGDNFRNIAILLIDNMLSQMNLYCFPFASKSPINWLIEIIQSLIR